MAGTALTLTLALTLKLALKQTLTLTLSRCYQTNPNQVLPNYPNPRREVPN